MYARRVLGDRSDSAEDIVQEAYLRLLGLAASDEAPTSARPWLFRVVRNLAIDERRSVARRADPVADTAILGAAALDDTAALVEQREELDSALRDMANLPPRERRAIEMDQAGIGAQQIAAELGTTPNAVHQALFRARRRMRSARAVAWGVVPIGMIPLLLRLSDPALAATITNLPPGLPVGRALPVAGLVAAAVVSGSVVAPDPQHREGPSTPASVLIAQAASDASDDDERSDRSGPSENSGPGSRNSGRDDDDEDRSGPNRGSDDDDDDRSGSNRGRGADDTPDGPDDSVSPNRGSGKGSGGAAKPESSDDEPGTSGKNTGSGKTTPTSDSSRDDAPDAPDAPDSPDD
jgi:RNA polymerase sigma-70 factor (ECF subfamily)